MADEKALAFLHHHFATKLFDPLPLLYESASLILAISPNASRYAVDVVGESLLSVFLRFLLP